ncbi:MAG: hypothetical protein RR395_05810 [Ruthenibacterium sp.]
MKRRNPTPQQVRKEIETAITAAWESEDDATQLQQKCFFRRENPMLKPFLTRMAAQIKSNSGMS